MLGRFDDKNREYLITDMYPRRPLLNYLWNDTTVCALDQFGFGTSWSVIDGKRRPIEGGERNLSVWNGERLVYIKDNDSGEFFASNRNYQKAKFDKFYCHVGIGYHTVVSEYKGVLTEFTTVVPTKGNVVQFKVSVKNVSEKPKNLSVYFMLNPKIENGGHEAYVSGDFDKGINGLYYDANVYLAENPYVKSFIATDKAVKSYAVSPDQFKGRYNGYDNPVGLESDKLNSVGSVFEESYTGALQYPVELQPSDSYEFIVACGFGKDYEECKKLSKEFANLSRVDLEIDAQKKKCGESLDVFKVETPDEYFNSLVNVWLKRQLSLGKDWGRLYGRGFRDVMQDTSAFVSLDVPLARKRIPEILRHQYEDGNPIRMFEPDYTHPYNDSGSWIPATVLGYILESGDISVLDEKTPFLKGDSYENAFGPCGFVPYKGTEEEYTVFEHLKRAMEYLYSSRGERGLVLFRHGDWNDSLNAVGIEGKGESVWLTIATVKAYNEFVEILDIIGEKQLKELYLKRRDELKENVVKYGYEDGKFIYGYNDYGEKIGSNENEYAKIFLNPQTWATLAGILDLDGLSVAMDKVEEFLSCDYGYVQCYPSYSKGSDRIGRVSYFKEGIIENGSVYNHGVAFKMVADCLLGRGDNAYKTFRKISAVNPLNPDNGMEPYAISNMYIGPESKYLKGYAPMSWVTGTAGWLYRATTEYLLGVRPVRGGLLIKPCFPKEWNTVNVTRIFRGAEYVITVKRGKGVNEFDKKELKGNVLPICGSGEKHTATIYFE